MGSHNIAAKMLRAELLSPDPGDGENLPVTGWGLALTTNMRTTNGKAAQNDRP
jgi:hypothetical protein